MASKQVGFSCFWPRGLTEPSLLHAQSRHSVQSAQGVWLPDISPSSSSEPSAGLWPDWTTQRPSRPQPEPLTVLLERLSKSPDTHTCSSKKDKERACASTWLYCRSAVYKRSRLSRLHTRIKKARKSIAELVISTHLLRCVSSRWSTQVGHASTLLVSMLMLAYYTTEVFPTLQICTAASSPVL